MFCSLRPEMALARGPTTAKKSSITIEHAESRLITPAKSPAGAQKSQEAIRSLPEVRRYSRGSIKKFESKHLAPSRIRTRAGS